MRNRSNQVSDIGLLLCYGFIYFIMFTWHGFAYRWWANDNSAVNRYTSFKRFRAQILFETNPDGGISNDVAEGCEEYSGVLKLTS